MARIKEYVDQVSTTADSPGRRAQPSDFGGEGMLAAGQAVSKVADTLVETAERQEVSDVHAKLAKARGDWTVALQERAQQATPGDTTFAGKFNQDLGDYLQTVETGIQTRAAKQAFQRGAAELSSHFVEKTGFLQAQMAGAKAVQDYNVVLNSYQNTVLADPTQFTQTIEAAKAALRDPNGLYAKMDPLKRIELEAKTGKDIARSAVEGLIQNGAAELAKRQLSEGYYAKYGIDADEAHKLSKEADVAIHAKENAVKEARLREEAQRKLEREAEKDKFMSRVIDPKGNGGYPSDREITSSRLLTAEDKKELAEYKLRRAKELAEGVGPKSNPRAVMDLMLRIDAPDGSPNKIINPDIVWKAAARGELNPHEYNFVRSYLDRAKDDGMQTTARRAAIARQGVERMANQSLILDTLDRANPGTKAEFTTRVMMDFEDAFAERRKANDSAGMRALLDPSSKDYFFTIDRLKSYMPEKGAMGPAADAVRAKEAPAARRGTTALPAQRASYRDYDSLPSGAEFIDPKGNVRRKP